MFIHVTVPVDMRGSIVRQRLMNVGLIPVYEASASMELTTTPASVMMGLMEEIAITISIIASHLLVFTETVPIRSMDMSAAVYLAILENNAILTLMNASHRLA